VTFTINGAAGEIIGSGNGDPSDHTPDASHERAAFSGRLAAIIRSTGKRGAVSVTAKSPGLNPVTIVVKFEK
jgi:beta-galactosidase